MMGDYCKSIPIFGMENPFHYRNKVHAVIATDKAGNPIAGTYQQGTHHVVPIHDCLLENEKASAIIQTVTYLLKEIGWKIYNEYTHRGLIRHVVVRVSETTGQLMLTIVVTSFDLPRLDQFVHRLLSFHPEITTIVLNQNARVTSAVLGTKEKVIYGPGYIEDVLLENRFRISSRSFYQVNSKMTQILYQKAIGLCDFQGNEILLDAYCGTGTIGICASQHTRRLIGVEINAAAVKDARINASMNQIHNADFYVGDAGAIIQKLSTKKMKPDVVIMDPPRAGSTLSFLDTLVKLSIPKVLYISCNPNTLRRDIDYLYTKGYNPDKAILIDLFPGTEHVETVLLMSQQKPDDTIHVGIDLKPEDVTVAESKATYAELQAYIEEKYSFKVSNLYIAQAKAALGIKERENYNKPKNPNSKKLVCPPDKMAAIQEALRHFKMI